jgi:repressor LexA
MLLTHSQIRIAKAIADAERKSLPLFVAQLVEKLGYAAESSLTPTLKILQRKGVAEIMGGGKGRAHRLVRLTLRGRAMMGLNGLPLLGAIPAGPLREAVAGAEDFVEVNSLMKSRPGDFLLRVAGDSMTGDGILDGDFVLLRPNVDLVPGEIAAVYAGENYESTLKRIFVESKQVRLKAGNPAYADIIIPRAEWRGVAGVFRGLMRNVSR